MFTFLLSFFFNLNPHNNFIFYELVQFKWSESVIGAGRETIVGMTSII